MLRRAAVVSFPAPKRFLPGGADTPSGLTVLTRVHVILSLLGSGAGLVVWAGLLRGKGMNAVTVVFLATTVLTSVTGYLFPYHTLLPSHLLGLLSLIVLALALIARYVPGLAGPWRKVYVVSAMLALYFNVLVLVVQAFQKVPP